MKKHILLGTALASLFALGACDYNEDNFPGFDEKDHGCQYRYPRIG